MIPKEIFFTHGMGKHKLKLQSFEAVGRHKQIVGADIVEVMPIPPNHITEFTAARLAYKIITFAQLSS